VAHTIIDNKFYADTAFLNSLSGIPGVELHHMGFGEFYATTPYGRVEFDRMRGVDFPGQSGRSHQVYDKAHGELQATTWLFDQMKSKGRSSLMASTLRTQIIRLAAAHPELRSDLLPLLKEDSAPESVDQNKPEHYYGLPPRGVQAAAKAPAKLKGKKLKKVNVKLTKVDNEKELCDCCTDDKAKTKYTKVPTGDLEDAL